MNSSREVNGPQNKKQMVSGGRTSRASRPTMGEARANQGARQKQEGGQARTGPTEAIVLHWAFSWSALFNPAASNARGVGGAPDEPTNTKPTTGEELQTLPVCSPMKRSSATRLCERATPTAQTKALKMGCAGSTPKDPSSVLVAQRSDLDSPPLAQGARATTSFLELQTKAIKGSTLLPATGGKPLKAPSVTAFEKVGGGARPLLQALTDIPWSSTSDATFTLFDESESAVAMYSCKGSRMALDNGPGGEVLKKCSTFTCKMPKLRRAQRAKFCDLQLL